MKKKLQVFISSTYTDMLLERQAAVEAILRAGHIPAGMELFAAGDESQMEIIRHWIDESDVFMLILGGRYGSIERNSGKSYIELEYEYAIKKKKPFFAAVISKGYLDAKVRTAGSSAMESDHGTKLKAFQELVTKKICRFFNDINELKLTVLESLLKFERDEKFVGWIRGSDVVDPKVPLEEMSRLQAENASLRERVKGLEKAELRVSAKASPPDCVMCPLTRPIEGTETAQAVYLRLWVENTGNVTAKNVEVYAQELRRKRADGTQEAISLPPGNLKWANLEVANCPSISPGMGRHCDLGRIVDPARRRHVSEDINPKLILNDGMASLAFMLTAMPNHKGHVIGPGEYLLDILVTAENADSVKWTVTINLRGTWHPDEAKMLQDGIGLSVARA